MEMRRQQRLYPVLPLRYQVSLLESEVAWNGEGTLKNISLSGIYFTCQAALLWEPGQVGDFSIATDPPRDQQGQVSSVKARGVVLRVERPAPDSSTCGIAVKFLTPLQLSLSEGSLAAPGGS